MNLTPNRWPETEIDTKALETWIFFNIFYLFFNLK